MYKKITTFLIGWILHTALLLSQPFTYFNQQILLDESNQLSVATIPHSEGYYTVGVFGFTHPIIYFAKIDAEGNVLTYHILDDSPNNTTLVTGRQFIKTDDGNFVLTYQQRVPLEESNSDIILIKFTQDGGILWKEQFGFERTDGPGEVIQTEGGGFLIVGFAWGEGYQETYVVKTDSRGNLEWEETYCMENSNWCEALSVDFTLDGGYILSGLGTNDIDNKEMYVLKINSLGKQQWDRNYGISTQDGGSKLKTLENGHYFLTGNIRENGVRKNYYAELGEWGEIIWDKVQNIHPNNSFAIRDYVFTGDGFAFMGVAHYNKTTTDLQPLLVKTDADANVIWKKTLTDENGITAYITDMDKIEGGYVLTGYKYFPTPQYGWMITIDEEGNFCEELGCVETIVDIEDIAVEKEVFVQISPNPVREQARIHYQIPKEGLLQVYDLQGKLMESWELKMEDEELVLDIEAWESGLYLYRVSIEGREVSSGKLVAE